MVKRHHHEIEMKLSNKDMSIFQCIPYVTDCVLAELEKLGAKYRIALWIVKDPRFVRLPCMHKGTYADDCLVQVRSLSTQGLCFFI